MQRMVLAILVMLLMLPVCLLAQEAETAASEETAADTIPIVRDRYYGTADGMRNFGTMESLAPLGSTHLLVPELTGFVVIRPDSIPDSLVVKLDIDLTKLTTGFVARDTLVLSKSFLFFDTLTTLSLNLLQVSRVEEQALANEIPRKATATAELMLGQTIDTVAVDLELTYLEGNKVTATRLPGNLLHLVVAFNFRLSDFGIKIPKPALLKLNDVISVKTDMFCSSEMQ